MKSSLIFYIFLAFVMVGCDIIEGDPYVRTNNPDPENPTLKRVVLLDFTGHKCPNCPEGHNQIKLIKNLYGNRFIPVAIHAGYYSTPSSSYPTDFRTEFGTSFHNLFNPTSYPIGMVDFIKRENLQTNGYWSEKVAEQMEKPSHLAISISAGIMENQINTVVTVQSNRTIEAEETYRLYVLLLEDSIVSKQKVGTTDVDNYVHDHVLRHGFTSYLGDSISLFNAHNQRTRTFQRELNPSWRTHHLSLVAFVANDQNEVIQAYARKLSPAR